MLEIFFDRAKANSAVELADPIILRFNRETGTALSLSILTFSRVAEPTELGPRSFRLNGLEALPANLRKVVVDIITKTPVSHFLKVGAYFSETEPSPIPISYLERSMPLPMTT